MPPSFQQLSILERWEYTVEDENDNCWMQFLYTCCCPKENNYFFFLIGHKSCQGPICKLSPEFSLGQVNLIWNFGRLKGQVLQVPTCQNHLPRVGSINSMCVISHNFFTLASNTFFVQSVPPPVLKLRLMEQSFTPALHDDIPSLFLTCWCSLSKNPWEQITG